MFPHISYRSSGEKLLKYQENLTWVIMLLTLMTSLTDKPLILQWEVWLRSLLGLKGLKWIATSQVRFLVTIEDLWLRKRILNLLLVDPTYCKLHFLHVTKYMTFLDHLRWLQFCLKLYINTFINITAYKRCGEVKEKALVSATLSFTPCGVRQTDKLIIWRTTLVYRSCTQARTLLSINPTECYSQLTYNLFL